MRALAGRGRKKEREFRRFWKFSGEKTSGGRASRRGRTNKRRTGTGGDGKSLTLGEYATYFISINSKNRGLSGGKG